MASETEISWCDATANFWWGCVKVSDPGLCTNCYAETWTNRFGGDFINRRRFIKSVWNDVPKWDRESAVTGVRKRIFCMSMGDFFEILPPTHQDFQQMQEARSRAFDLIESTTSLDWLILTKRIPNVKKMVPRSWLDRWPKHIRLGISVGTQPEADRDIPRLQDINCPNFLSMEPLLEQVSVLRYLRRMVVMPHEKLTDRMVDAGWSHHGGQGDHRGIEWLVCGGESGSEARPSHPDWFRLLRDECAESGTPFHMKQWGEHAPISAGPEAAARACHHTRRKCAGMSLTGKDSMFLVGKKAAGHLLDGVEYHQFPGDNVR